MEMLITTADINGCPWNVVFSSEFALQQYFSEVVTVGFFEGTSH